MTWYSRDNWQESGDLSPLQEQVARQGTCPFCHTRTLEDWYVDRGIVFLFCHSCSRTMSFEEN